MQKWWWSSLLFLALGAAGLYLTATQFNRSRAVAPLRALLPDSPGQEQCHVEPLILLPQKPPRFFLDLDEPIVVRPDFDEAVQPTGFTSPYAPLPQPPVTTRMPYADEVAPTAAVDTVLWNVLTDVLQKLLPEETETVPAAELEEDPTENLVPLDDATDSGLHMPLVPAMRNYHSDHPHCPHLHGHGNYPTFGQPAYQFPRQ